MQILSVLSVLGLVAANSKIAKLPSGRIVGGYEVQPQFKYPWIVSLQYLDEHNCGGTLYNEKTVISAAHCAFANTKDWTASIHRHDLEKTAEEEGGKTYNVTSRIIHPEYDINSDNGNDVSIWILATEGTKKSDLLYDDGSIANSDTSVLTVIGWGATGEGIDSALLLEVKVPVFNITKCQNAYETLDTKSQFCAGYPEGGKDSCQGDSGGPIFSESNGVFTLVGVVSWGRGCAEPNQPGVYTRISTVQDFINQNAV